jgi:hypothetical protein
VTGEHVEIDRNVVDSTPVRSTDYLLGEMKKGSL